MAFAISTTSNYHWVRKVIATTYGNGVLKLTLVGEQSPDAPQYNTVEINVFTDNAPLTERLCRAISGVYASEAEVV